MAFTVEDFPGLLRLLEQHPEWRVELRRRLLTEELLELPTLVRELAEQFRELAASQPRAAAALEALAGRTGKLEGDMLEPRYERRAPASFSRLARKLRVVDTSALAEMLDEAVDAGRLAEAERQPVLDADLVLSGQRREDQTDAYFVVEVSVGVGDVTRAAERAGILAKLGRPVVPVVAGEWINPEAIAAAQAHGVWQVLDGRTTPPGGRGQSGPSQWRHPGAARASCPKTTDGNVHHLR